MTKKENRLILRGELLYRRLRKRLERKFKGSVLAIEPESGKYIVGHDELDVAEKAFKTFRGVPVDFYRIGYPALHKFRRSRLKKPR